MEVPLAQDRLLDPDLLVEQRPLIVAPPQLLAQVVPLSDRLGKSLDKQMMRDESSALIPSCLSPSLPLPVPAASSAGPARRRRRRRSSAVFAARLFDFRRAVSFPQAGVSSAAVRPVTAPKRKCVHVYKVSMTDSGNE